MIAFIRYEESKAFLTVQETAKLLKVSVGDADTNGPEGKIVK